MIARAQAFPIHTTIRGGDGVVLIDLDAHIVGSEPDRLVIVATNQGGYDSTRVDLLDVIAWVKEHRPDLIGALLPLR